MTKHCRNCSNHLNAGHPPDSNMAGRYNDWCCKASRIASKAVGECKLKGWRHELLSPEQYEDNLLAHGIIDWRNVE